MPTAYCQPTAGAGRPRGKTRRTGKTGRTGKTRILVPLVPPAPPCSRVSFLIPAPQVHHNFQLSIFNFQFSWVSFLIPAPKAHLESALRIVGGEAIDESVAAGESRKGVKKRRRQTLCLRSIRFRLCDSRLRQRCGAWLLRHFCHQKWQREWATWSPDK